jgi:hypothetical protein
LADESISLMPMPKYVKKGDWEGEKAAEDA